MSLLIALFFIAFVLIIILLQPSRVIYIRILSVPALCVLFIICLIVMSASAVRSALNGLQLWASIVVPSLFPFFVAAEVMNFTGFIRAFGILLEPVMRPFFNVPGCGSFPLSMGVTSGYPVGAKITCDLRSKGLLTKTEAERLLTFTNNSGPLFIIGAVGTGMYGSPRLGVFFLICHFLACITVGYIFRFYKTTRIKKRNEIFKQHVFPTKSFKKTLLDNYKSNKYSFGTILGEAIKNSVSTIMIIGGFIVLFSVIIQLLTETGIIKTLADASTTILLHIGIDNQIIRGVISGLFEITTGSRLVSSASNIFLYQQLPAISFILGWAGLSVHFQVISIAAKTDISIRPYFIGKLLHGIFSAFYTWVGLKWFRLDTLILEPVLSNSNTSKDSWLSTLGHSIWSLFAILTVFIAFFAVGQFRGYIVKKIRKTI